jgi:putative transposase
VTTYLDITTRRAVGFSAWIAESQMAIWAALRDMVLNPECGVMAIHYSDNGAYRGGKHRSVIERLGGTLMFSQPYRAQARGAIERLNSSVWVPFAKEFPTYCGDDMDQEALKKALRSADDDGANLMAWKDFITAARQMLDDYNNRPHSSLKKQTPNTVWEQAVDEGWQSTLLENDDLHDLLPCYTRKVNRGWVSLQWGHYFDDRLRDYHGKRVWVGIIPTDGSRVWCSDDSKALICLALRDNNKSVYVPTSQLEAARAKREAGRVRRLERKIDAALEEGAAQFELPPSDIEVRPTFPQSAPMRTLDEETEQRLNQIIDLPIRKRELTIDEEKDQTFEEWEELHARIEAGEELSASDRQWHQDYQQFSEFRTRWHMKYEFGKQQQTE